MKHRWIAQERGGVLPKGHRSFPRIIKKREEKLIGGIMQKYALLMDAQI
jgi:hypothetical protein